jgi:lipopolysaccharide export LptBFGC system permease protein LptF
MGATHPTLLTVWLVFLTPGALPLALPVGATLGTALGAGGHNLSRRRMRAALVLGIAGSAASFATTAWLLPASQRAFYAAMTGNDIGSHLPDAFMVAELSQMGAMYKWTPTNQAQLVAVSYHARWAITFAPFVLSLLMLSVNTRRRGRVAATVYACAAMFGYYAMIYGSRELAYSGRLPGLAAAWLPNAIVILIAASVAMIHPAVSGRPEGLRYYY